MTEQPTKPVTPYQERHRKIVAAIVEWQTQTNAATADPADAVSSLIDLLHDHDLQILPHCPHYTSWRVLIDGEPAPSLFAYDRPSGPLDANEAVEAFLLATATGEGQHREITIRPASSREMVAKLVGDYAVYEEPVEIDVETCVIVPDEDRPGGHVLSATGNGGTVALRMTADFWAALTEGPTVEAVELEGGA